MVVHVGFLTRPDGLEQLLQQEGYHSPSQYIWKHQRGVELRYNPDIVEDSTGAWMLTRVHPVAELSVQLPHKNAQDAFAILSEHLSERYPIVAYDTEYDFFIALYQIHHPWFTPE